MCKHLVWKRAIARANNIKTAVLDGGAGEAALALRLCWLLRGCYFRRARGPGFGVPWPRRGRGAALELTRGRGRAFGEELVGLALGLARGRCRIVTNVLQVAPARPVRRGVLGAPRDDLRSTGALEAPEAASAVRVQVAVPIALSALACAKTKQARILIKHQDVARSASVRDRTLLCSQNNRVSCAL